MPEGAFVRREEAEDDYQLRRGIEVGRRRRRAAVRERAVSEYLHDCREVEAQLRHLKARVRALGAAQEALEENARALRRELALTRSGAGWQALEAIRRLRLRALRPGTLRDRLFRLVLRGLDAGVRLGPAAVVGQVLRNPRRLALALRVESHDRLPFDQQYQVWLEGHRLRPDRIATIRQEMTTFWYQPLVSIVMPVFNTDAGWLRACLDSLEQQLYPRWELCATDDASTAPHVRPMLEAAAAADRRITIRSLPRNEGIAGASNHSLARATGEFVALMDSDDVLAPDALYEVVRRLNDDPALDLIYTDHDLLDPRGRRFGPLFKPDWSPDLLLSMNYITHFCVYRRELVQGMGGFRKEVNESQDYDLLLRATEVTGRIAHIPKPLYSWGQAPTSGAANPTIKRHAHEAGKRALQDALVRRGIEGEVLDGLGEPYRYRVKRKIVGTPLVSIIIPSRNNWRLLDRCLRSLDARTHYPQLEVLVIDNGSTDPKTLAYLGQLRHRVLPFPGPFHFARMNNVGAMETRGEHLLFLNDDTEAIGPEWLTAMLEHAQRPEVGAVGAKLLYPNGTIQHAGVVVGIQGKAGHAYWGFPGDHPGYYGMARVIRNYSAVTAACLMTRRAVFEEVGGFDEAFDISYNDVDLCLRMRERGYLVVYTPYAVLFHHQSASRGPYNPVTDRKYEELLRQRWQQVFVEGDPYYSPHLTLDGVDFSLRL